MDTVVKSMMEDDDAEEEKKVNMMSFKWYK